MIVILQVQAWRADPSTADRAKDVWSELGSTNNVIAKMFNALATTATESDSAGGNNFETGARVSHDP